MKRIFFTILTTTVIIYAMWLFSPKNTTDGIHDIKVTSPDKKDISDYVNVSGKIKEGNKRNIYISNLGEVIKINVNIGDEVSVGDVLGEIKPFNADKHIDGIYDIGFHDFSALLPVINSELEIKTDEITRVILKNQPISVISPISGIITEVNVKEGDLATPFSKIFSVSDFSNLYILANIPEAYSLKVNSEDKVSISSAAFGNKIFSGKIDNISPVAKYLPSLTGEGETYIEAIISIDNKNALLRPGLNVNAKININTKKDALTLPYECILQDEKNREYVYCMKDGVVKKRLINTGYELENEVEIKSGLNAADLVILNPDEIKFENEMKV